MAFGRLPPMPRALEAPSLIAAVAIAVVALGGIGAWLFISGPLRPPPVVVVVPAIPAPPPPVAAPPPDAVAPAVVAAAPEPAATAASEPAPPPPAKAEPAPLVSAPMQPIQAQPGGFKQGGGALPPAPDSGLIEKGGAGFLPIIGRDGRQPWQVYARPFDLADKRPRIAIIISDLAGSATETDAAIHSLPPAVTLSFMPYRKRLGEWISLARAAGHEVLLDLPMEPPDALNHDPGPNALRTALDPAANLSRLEWMMSQATGYVGMVGFMGGRFSGERSDLQPILDDVQKRGLLYVDNRSTPQSVAGDIAKDFKLPFAVASRILDTDPSGAAVDRKLSELEDLARAGGSAVGLSQPLPIVLERIAAWSQTLGTRGVVIAPISAVVSTHPPPPAPAPAVAAPAPAAAAPAEAPAKAEPK